jgi:hypothetical protein
MATLPTMRSKIPPGSGSASWVNQFLGKYVTVGPDAFSEKHRNRALTSGNKGCAELRVPEEMDRPPVPFGQSDHWEDSTRKPKRE